MRLSVLFSLALIVACGAIQAQAQCADTLGDPPEFMVHALRLNGLERVNSADRETIHNSIVGKCFGAMEELAEVIRDTFQRLGFFKAAFNDKPKLKPTGQGGGVNLADVEADLDPGRKYTFNSVSFRGARAFSAAQLRPLIPLKAGDVFDVEKIRNGLKALQALYGEHGYINFTPIPETQIDEDAGTIQVSFDMDEGTQFKVGEIAVVAPEALADQLYAHWPLKPGAIYNSKEAGRFLVENAGQLSDIEIIPDTRTKTVTIRLVVCPPDHVCPAANR